MFNRLYTHLDGAALSIYEFDDWHYRKKMELDKVNDGEEIQMKQVSVSKAR